jgi:hypothetical protein
VQVIFAERRKTGQLDLEQVEMGLRAAVHRGGAPALAHLLDQGPPEERKRSCSCGRAARYVETRWRSILTVLGPVEVCRAYYWCNACQQSQIPADQEWDIEGTEFSPGVRRMMALVGQECSFDAGRQQLEMLAGLEVTTKAIERIAESIGSDIEVRERETHQQAMQSNLPVVVGLPIPVLYIEMDGTGIPVVAAETEGRAGKIEGQPPRTREVKLGCVFTQTLRDDEGRPIRDPDSTTYTGAIESTELFARRIYTEALQRGWDRALKKVVLGDGARWIWALVELLFPGAIQIVDLYHAREHLWTMAAQLYPGDDARQRRWAMVQQNRLDHGHVAKIVATLHLLVADSPKLCQQLQTEADYFERNAERMRYPEFRRQGLFVSSGVIEAGCKTIGARLKRSGMFWTVRGANAILALRCQMLSGKFDDYWEARRA